MNDLHIPVYNNSFCSVRTRPYTAFNIQSKNGIFTQIINSLSINKEKDYLFICYGTVDIRYHIGFQAQKNNTSIEEEVNKCVQKYLTFILEWKNIYPNIGVYAPIASGISNGIQGNGRPSYKTSVERNKITRFFTDYLKIACEKNNIIFKSIFKSLQKDSITNVSYYADDIHLNTKAYPLLEAKFQDIIQSLK